MFRSSRLHSEVACMFHRSISTLSFLMYCAMLVVALAGIAGVFFAKQANAVTCYSVNPACMTDNTCDCRVQPYSGSCDSCEQLSFEQCDVTCGSTMCGWHEDCVTNPPSPPPPSPCVPNFTSCADAGKNCGAIINSCLISFNCGSCAGPGSCGGFTSTCDETGTQSIQNCVDNVCTAGTQSCSRSTSGNSCSSWGACGGFTSTCDETGTQSRPTCSGGTCSGSESQSCSRSTTGGVCGSWGLCSVTCNGGTQSRPLCSGGTCSGSESQVCNTQSCGVCTPGDSDPCGSGSCAGTHTCSGSSTWGSCSSSGSAC